MRKRADGDAYAQALYLSFIGDMLEQYVQWLRKWYGDDDEAAID